MARVEDDVAQDEVLERHVGKVAVGVDHVFDRLVELDVGIGDVGQRRHASFEVLAFEIFDVFGKPQRQAVESEFQISNQCLRVC